MLNLNTYSYIVKFYYWDTLSATYNDSVQSVGVHLDCRVEDDCMKTLPPIVKHQTRWPRKQRISSIGGFKSSSKCSNCNCKGH